MRHLLALSVLLGATALSAASEPRPNFVILLADDLGWGDVGFNGRTDWQTPHLDKLAAQGTVFKRWYVAAVVCAPSRAALLTGKYTIHNGVSGNNDDLPPDAVTLAAALKKHGYATALFGKWHHGKIRPEQKSYRHPLDLGFDEFVGFTDARDAWEHFPKKLWFGRQEKPVAGHADTIFTDHALNFLKANKDRPFFLYVPFIIPHLHIEAMAEDVAEFKGRFPEKDPTKPIRATYAAMVTRLDKEYGRILRALDDLGLADNTIVLFSSDHGATFEVGNQGASAFHDSNRPFRGGKRTLLEGGIRVPAVVRWPGKIPAGQVTHEIVHNIDVLPTFLSAAGVKPEAAWKVDGADLLSVWQGKAKAPERTLFWEWRAEGYNQLAAMRGDLKLFVTPGNPAELYNVETDPAERRTLVAEYPMIAQQLRKELDAWMATETEVSKWGKPVKKLP